MALTLQPRIAAFLLGDGFFETMAAQNGHIVRFKDHMERLNLTSQKLNLPLPYSHEEIEQAIKDILLASQLTTCRAAIRLTITRGSGPRRPDTPVGNHTQRVDQRQ